MTIDRLSVVRPVRPVRGLSDPETGQDTGHTHAGLKPDQTGQVNRTRPDNRYNGGAQNDKHFLNVWGFFPFGNLPAMRCSRAVCRESVSRVRIEIGGKGNNDVNE